MRIRPGVVLASVATLGYAAVQLAGRISGSTRAERSRVLPGDDLIARPGLVTNHAATLGGPPEEVWPWLTQMGWHRGGWYTPRWIDRILFPRNWASKDMIDPSLAGQLQPGDTIPDGPPGTARFLVEIADEPRTLVLHSTSHLPAVWSARLGARLDWVWIFQLDPVGDDRTRLLLRTRGTVRPWWINVAYQAAIVPADHVMATGMLRGLGQRVARDRRLSAYLRRRAGR